MMYKQMDGALFRNLLDYGIRNLSAHSEEVNAQNVFPVPDGDTGTNMVTTLQNGYAAIGRESHALHRACEQFSGAVVYGARGNSGVIVSQFFKGFCRHLTEPEKKETATAADLIAALEQGVTYAYAAVSRPTEGTILTVVREATEYVARSGIADNSEADLHDLIKLFLHRAKISLESTPELLPVLKQAGVVDSGAMGIIFVFEGMMKFLLGEELREPTEALPRAVTDYARFHRKSEFTFGFCTELLMQLLDAAEPYDEPSLRKTLEGMGDSIVYSLERDKVKLHIHTKAPEQVLGLMRRYGELLSVKIENMTVQHTALPMEQDRVIRRVGRREVGSFAVVAVAQSKSMTELFGRMGASVVLSLNAAEAPSAQNFVQAYEAAECETILVFPNNPNYLLTARQAAELFDAGRVTVLPSGSVADCYAALAQMDFLSDDPTAVAEEAVQILSNVYDIRLTTAARDAVYEGVPLKEGEILALRGSSLLASGEDITSVACRVLTDTMEDEERDTLTVFYGLGVSRETLDALRAYSEERYLYLEISEVETEDPNGDVILSFE